MSPTDDSPEHDEPTPEGSAEIRANKDHPESLLDWMNRPRPSFKDEALAPPVDRELLAKLVRNELDEEQAEEAYRLVFSFRSWDEAHTEILTKFFREAADESQPGDK